jgi:molybdopterin converting factor small subunit
MTTGSEATCATTDVTIRYWASARAAAGCDTDSFPGRRVGDVLEAASVAHPRLRAVLEVSTILLDGRPVLSTDPLPDSLPAPAPQGSVLEVLPPFAGG